MLRLVDDVDTAVACCLGTDEAAAELQALTGEGAGVLAGQLLIHTEHIAYLTTAYADVASGYVHVGTDVAPQLQDEGLAETHDFSVALAAGREVRAALAATHRQGSECIFEGLLET